jgi:hypothetical protein
MLLIQLILNELLLFNQNLKDLYGSDDVKNDILDDNDVVATLPHLKPNVTVSVVARRVPCAKTNIDNIIVNRVEH